MANDADSQSAREFLEQCCGDADPLDTAQAQYARSKNPWWLFWGVSCISHERADGKNTPIAAWIIDALFEAAASVAPAVICGPDVWEKYPKLRAKASMDVALGIKPQRGGRRYDNARRVQSARNDIFRVIERLRSCYDIDIPTACESAYYFRDVDSLVIGTAIVEDWKDRGRFADDATFQQQMRETFDENYKTFGERMGCSLDSLIDRYYREGEGFRQECLLAAECDEPRWREVLRAQWAMDLLGMARADCSVADIWVTPDADARRYAKRPEFAALCAGLGL